MKQRKLGPLLAVTLSLELMVSPIIPAVQAQTNSGSGGGSQVNPGMDKLNKGLQILDTVLQATRPQGSQMSPRMAQDMAGLQGQQTPGPDKYFNLQKLGQIPGLANYLALNNINPNMLNCATLPTTLYDARPEVCRLGLTGDSGMAQQAQLGQMYSYYNQYFQISKTYKNYSADSNADGQAFGVGCMNNAMNILNGFFKYRIDELDKLTTNLEAMQNQFREASRADLDAIEEAVAVLDGGDSQLANKVRSKNPDLFDFKKRFDNPACNSMFAGEALNDRGRNGGLNTINSELKKTLTAKSGKYSGESYSAAHAAVMEDINNLADKVSKQFELNYSVLSKDPTSYGKFLAELPDTVSSTHGTNRAITPDLFADVQSKFNESFVKLNEKKSTIASELGAAGISADVATNLLGNTTSSNFESEVATIENRLKNKCFEQTISEVGVDRMMDKIYDPSSSGFANKNASNFYKDKLNAILEDTETSLEKKLSQLRALESQTGSRYYIKMENSYEVQEVDQNGDLKPRVVRASNNRTPTVFFSDLIRNCEAQFKTNKLNNKMSGANAIQQLRNLNQEYKALAKSQAADMKKELRKKMIECENPEDANNTVPGSCTPERFNTSSAGFCAKAAFSCSKNMQACSQQADNFVKEIKAQKTARVNNYKALVEKNKRDIVKIFDSALTRYMQDGEMMRGIFGAGFSSPAGIQREVPEGQRYLAEFQQATSQSPDGSLLLEDPDKYVEMFKKNIDLLKKSVADQQNQILGGNAVGKSQGLLAEHIRKTEKNYRDVAKEADSLANQCIQNHDNAVRAAEAARQEQMKKQSELGEKRNEYCRRFNMAANGNPNPACSGAMSDMMAVSDGSLEAICAQTQNTSEALTNRGAEAFAYCEINHSSSDETSTDPVARACGKLLARCTSNAVPSAGSATATATVTTTPQPSQPTTQICTDDFRAGMYSIILNSGSQDSSEDVSATVAEASQCVASHNSNDRFSDFLDTFRRNLTPQSAGATYQ